jgi:hypothetical protein
MGILKYYLNGDNKAEKLKMKKQEECSKNKFEKQKEIFTWDHLKMVIVLFYFLFRCFHHIYVFYYTP